MTMLERLGIYMIIGGLLFAAVAALYARYEYIVKQNQELRLEKAQEIENTKAAEREAAFAKGRLSVLDEIQAQRDKREKALTNQLSAIRRDLNDLKARDPVVQKWADEPLPPAIAGRLRAGPNGAQGDGAGEAPRQPDRKVPGASVRRPD